NGHPPSFSVSVREQLPFSFFTVSHPPSPFFVYFVFGGFFPHREREREREGGSGIVPSEAIQQTIPFHPRSMLFPVFPPSSFPLSSKFSQENKGKLLECKRN
ncbi:hypothetical protein F2P56_035360, partial [Juglans regia]